MAETEIRKKGRNLQPPRNRLAHPAAIMNAGSVSLAAPNADVSAGKTFGDITGRKNE